MHFLKEWSSISYSIVLETFYILPNKQCNKYSEDFLRMHTSNHVHVARRPGSFKGKNNLTSFSEMVSYKGKYLHILFHSFFFVLKMLRSNLSFTGELTIMKNRRSLLQSVWSSEQQAAALNSMKTRDRREAKWTHWRERLWQSFTRLTYYERSLLSREGEPQQALPCRNIFWEITQKW